MNCAEAEQFFDAYLDGELTGSLRLEFDAHRLRCAGCQQKLAMMEAFAHVIAGDSREPVPSDDFTERVMQQVDERRVLRIRSRRSRIVAAASVLVPAAAIGLFAIAWPFGAEESATPAAPVARTVSSTVDRMVSERDAVGLYGYILDRAEQIFVGAGKNLAQDVNSMRNYAAEFTLPETGSGLFHSLLDTDAPADEVETPPDQADIIRM